MPGGNWAQGKITATTTGAGSAVASQDEPCGHAVGSSESVTDHTMEELLAFQPEATPPSPEPPDFFEGLFYQGGMDSSALFIKLSDLIDKGLSKTAS